MKSPGTDGHSGKEHSIEANRLLNWLAAFHLSALGIADVVVPELGGELAIPCQD